MAAAKGNKNAAGNSGGKSLQDRELASQVRSLALGHIKAMLDGTHPRAKDGDFYKAILIKLAGAVLPRLNEHSGEGGGPIEQRVIYLPQRNDRMETTSRQADRSPDDSAG